ncbi:MAG TPA: hypothetical protein GX521_09590 [Firmicutes bacterium]|nr:hypothetical protein [Bacillota bacterium]
MMQRFIRDLVLALGIILVMAVLVNIDVDFIEPVKDYISFIVSTDFSLEPVLSRVEFLQPIAEWDLGSWFRAWPQVFSGR